MRRSCEMRFFISIVILRFVIQIMTYLMSLILYDLRKKLLLMTKSHITIVIWLLVINKSFLRRSYKINDIK